MGEKGQNRGERGCSFDREQCYKIKVWVSIYIYIYARSVYLRGIVSRKLVCKHGGVVCTLLHFARISIEINVSPSATRYVQIEVA